MPPDIIKQEHLDLHGAIVPAHELQPSPCLTPTACAAWNLSAEFLLSMFLRTDTTANCTQVFKTVLADAPLRAAFLVQRVEQELSSSLQYLRCSIF